MIWSSPAGREEIGLASLPSPRMPIDVALDPRAAVWTFTVNDALIRAEVETHVARDDGQSGDR
jgi:hypothetical protein